MGNNILQEFLGSSKTFDTVKLQDWCKRFIAEQTGHYQRTLTRLCGLEGENLEQYGRAILQILISLRSKITQPNAGAIGDAIGTELIAISKSHLPLEAETLPLNDPRTDIMRGISANYLRCLGAAHVILKQTVSATVAPTVAAQSQNDPNTDTAVYVPGVPQSNQIRINAPPTDPNADETDFVVQQ